MKKAVIALYLFLVVRQNLADRIERKKWNHEFGGNSIWVDRQRRG